jgi:glycosyltransferase involved in cell wall biosynthesis
MGHNTSIAVLTAWPPSRDNKGWPTALPWYLLAHPPEDVDVHLFYFRGDEKLRGQWARDVEALKLASVTELEPFWSRWEHWSGRWRRHSRRGLPIQMDWFPVRKKTIEAITAKRPDVAWLYPHWLTPWVPHFPAKRVIVTGPDSGVLHCERAIRQGTWRTVDEVEREVRSLSEYTKLERELISTGALVHVVGREDARRYNDLAAGREVARFITHPHFEYRPATRRLDEVKGKLRVFFNGNATSVYMGDHAVRIAAALEEHSASLAPRLAIDFVGKNWEAIVSSLAKAGYETTHRNWVDDFAATIAEYDIAICPYAVGAGTKGKVLQLMATGVLTIGTKIAFENICAEAGKDYVAYERPEDVVGVLGAILKDRKRYAEVASGGAEAVRENHSPVATAGQFWEVVMGATAVQIVGSSEPKVTFQLDKWARA